MTQGPHCEDAASPGDRAVAAAGAGGVGTFEWDLRTGILTWDAQMLVLFGYAPSEFDSTIEAFEAKVHPEDRPRVRAALQEAITTVGPFAADYRVQPGGDQPGGDQLQVSARGRVVDDGTGTGTRLLGAAYDVTAVADARDRLSAIIDSMSVGFLTMDEDWRITYVNTEAERILGPRDHLLGELIWTLFPATVGTVYEESYRRAATAGEVVSFDAYYPAPLDRWFELRAVPDGRGLSLYFLDITDRRRVQDDAERAASRSRLLAQVATDLAATLDVEQALTTLVTTLVPELADACLLTLVDDADTDSSSWRTPLRDVASWHADPALREVLAEYAATRATAVTEDSVTARALRTGQPVLLHGDAAARGTTALATPRARELWAELHPEALHVLPLLGRGRVLGLLTALTGDTRGTFDPLDALVLQQVAAQIGLALDNARLHARQRRLSEELQLSLLTALPQLDHLQLVARYQSAAQDQQVGGDWYDAFATSDGSTSLVVGDVSGHDREAAVAMAQVRNLLRGVAHSLTDPPAGILTVLDRALRDLGVSSLVTAVLARVEQTPEQAEQGLRLLRWSNAGHLPPLLINPDGSAELLRRPSDLLLGLTADTDRHDHTQLLHPGASVVLYTDGLVERRGEHLTQSLERLRETAHELAGQGLSLQDLCDGLLAAAGTGLEDDVAMLAVRTHREYRPRPHEAGPRVLPEDLARMPDDGLTGQDPHQHRGGAGAVTAADDREPWSSASRNFG